MSSLLQCDVCGRSHRDERGVAQCRGRAERAAARAAKKEAEAQRRRDNLAEMLPDAYIRDRMRIGWNYEKCLTGLKNDYPTPDECGVESDGRTDQWNIWLVVELRAKQLNWMPVYGLRRTTEMLLFRFFTGEWGTARQEGVRDVLDEVVRSGDAS